MSAPSTLPVTLYPSKRKVLWMVAAMLAFLLASVWKFDEDRVAYGSFAVFCVLFVVASFAYLNPRFAYLKLTTAGFEIRNFRALRFIPWSDVVAFVPLRIGRLDRVGWRTAPPKAGATLTQRMNEALTGLSMTLPDTYGLTTDELARLMNDLLRKYGAAPRS